MVQRRGPMALSQDSKTPALLLSSSQELNSITSGTNASQLGLAPSPSEYIRSPPFHPWGPLALLPQMWCWAYGAWLDAQRHHWFQALGLCREACACAHTHTHTHTHTNGSKRLPLVCITHTISQKKMSNNHRSGRLHMIAETTHPS